MASAPSSQLNEDIKSLDNKLYKLQYSIINLITQKAVANKYSKNEINYFIENVRLVNKFEKIIYVNLVNTIRSYNLVLQILFSGDDQIISDGLRKCTFFFGDVKFTPEYYIEKVFPRVSYANRNKLFNAIAQNSNTARNEKFYTILNKIYNHQTAKPFLPYSSEEFIIEKLYLEIKLSKRELLIVQKRNPRFALKYFEELCKLCSNRSSIFFKDNLKEYDELIHRLLPLFTNEILELSKKYKEYFNFPKVGKRSSKNIIKKAKNFLIANSNEYNKYLKISHLYRYFHPAEFCLFYQNLMASKENFDPTLSYGPLKKHLAYYKTNEKKLDLLMKSYTNCYGNSLMSNLSNISPESLLLFPFDERTKLAQLKIQQGGDKYLTNIEWMKFLPIEISIPKFYDEISLASDSKKRIQIIKLMIESCGINQDYKSLLEVLKYFNKRHRNEIECSSEIFSIIEINFDLYILNEKYGTEVLLIFDKMLTKANVYRISEYRQFYVKPIEYAIKNNLNLNLYLKNYIKWIQYVYDVIKFKIFNNNKEWNKLCLLEIGKLLPEMNFDQLKFETNIEYLYTAITDWNKTNRNDTLSIMDYEWAVQYYEKKIEKDFHGLFIWQLQYDEKAAQYFQSKTLKKEYFDIFYIQYFIKWNTELIRIGQDEIIKNMFNVKEWKHFIGPSLKELFKIEGIEKAIRENCVKHFKNVDSNCRADALRFMVEMNWLNKDDFFKFVEDINPATKKIQLGTDREEKLIVLRKSLVYCIKYFKTEPEALKTIILYTQGDYLKYSIGTLYDICMKLPHHIVVNFLSSFMNSAVAFKKHIIRLKCLISKHEENLIYLQDLWCTEDHPTIRSVLMKLIIAECLYDSEKTCEFVWKCIQSLTSQDKSLVDELHIPIAKIFKTKRGKYLEDCWPLVDKNSENRQAFLEAFKTHIDLLSPKFIEQVLIDNLFKLNIENQEYFIRLSISFILMNSSEQRLLFLLNIMRKSIGQDWHTLTEDNNNNLIFKLRNLISYFCSKFAFEVILYKHEISVELFKLFENNLNKIIKESEVYLYDSYWTIKFAYLFLSSNKSIELFGNQLKHLIRDASNTNEYVLLTKFLNVLKNFLKTLWENNLSKNKIKIIEGLVSEPNCAKCVLIAVNLIENEDLKNNNFKQFYENLFKCNVAFVANAINYKLDNRI